MRALVLVLALLTGCAPATFEGPGPTGATLGVLNRSGGVVRVYYEMLGTPERLGRAYPGPTCLRLRVGTGQIIRFGFQHLAESIEWSGPFPVDDGSGFIIEITSPRAIRFDLGKLRPSMMCR